MADNFNLNTAIFYTCGTCNLQCAYCGIDKSPILKKIDEALGKSFENESYYFERVKKYFPDRSQLIRVETWGGEPFFKMERIHSLLRKLIKHYPYFEQMYSSTNFSYPSWNNQLFNLLNVLGEYEDRDFIYELQLSIDGPAYINDRGRGNGVTEKCLQNYRLLIQNIKNGKIPKNVELRISLKATLDNESLHLLNDKAKLIEYFQFFEHEFLTPFKEVAHLNQVKLHLAAPNTAVPSPVTKKDGEQFAEICKKCREIEVENTMKHYFEQYTNITFFSFIDVDQTPSLTYKHPCYTCGSGITMIGFLPDNMLSICHEGFTHFAMEYKKQAALSERVNNSTITFDKFLTEQAMSFCVDDVGYEKHTHKMHMFNTPNTTGRLMTITAQIISLAMAGQIEEYYLDQENALKAAIFLQEHTAFCIKDNYNKTGSFAMIPHGLIKLLLNGALQYIVDPNELQINEEDYCGSCNQCYKCR